MVAGCIFGSHHQSRDLRRTSLLASFFFNQGFAGQIISLFIRESGVAYLA